MKIVIATPLYPPEIGGPATYCVELEQGLPSRGFEITTVRFGAVRALPRILRHVVYAYRVYREAKTADLVLALDPVSVGVPALIGARLARKPLVVKIVGDYAWEQGVQRFGVTQTLDEFVRTTQASFFVRVLQICERMVASRARAVIVPSPYLKNIVSAWGIDIEKIMVIYNGIALPASLPHFERVDEEFLIISAGRRVPWKGFEAIERVAKRDPKWRVVILSGRPREEVLGAMRAANVFVLNSMYEGFPHALLEAMMLGTPVVASDIQAHRDLVGDSALLVSPRDDHALEQALVEIEANPDEARRRAEEAKRRMEMFSLDHMLDTTAEFLKKI